MTRFATLIILATVSAILTPTQHLAADTVYIRDTLYVPLRGGQSTEHRILHRGLKSGTRMERLEINNETGYSRVRTESGLEGWLQNQYLVEEPIASQQLDAVTAELQDLEAQHQQALLRLREITDQHNEIANQLGSTSADKDRLTQELSDITNLAANVIAIDEENKRVAEEQETLLLQIRDLTRANESLQNDDSQQWFLRGAGTVLLGLLFGFWIGRRIYQRRNTGGWG